MSIRVFLADDHGVMRDGLRLLLESQTGIEVIGEAGDGLDALNQMTLTCPDVAIVDIAMPELNGIEVVHRLQTNCPATRCLILSMHSSSEHVYRAFQAGARGYILKETAGNEVVEAVYAVHNGQRYLSQDIADTVITGFLSQFPGTTESSPLESLSDREREILQLVAEGLGRTEIAERLVISPKTVDTYRNRLMEKLAINDIPALVRFAIQHGVISIE